MDLQQTLRALYFERARIDQVIAALEDLDHTITASPRNTAPNAAGGSSCRLRSAKKSRNA